MRIPDSVFPTHSSSLSRRKHHSTTPRKHLQRSYDSPESGSQYLLDHHPEIDWPTTLIPVEPRYKHYDYVLTERCDVVLDSGVGCYLRGIRIHDTTNDYYRSFSDPTGNRFLQTIMDRDDCFREVPAQPPEITEQYTNGQQELVFPVGPPETRSGVITKEPIFIPKGTIITIGSPCGINGNVSFSNQSNLPTPSKRIDLY